ncbi:methyltransferase [candidate division MSBL1 archaeon SCGC-AAA382A20]|uniref:[methylamine--corrinoid protein] Co-methyltransferase n=1 Tax=candidate division MSBL1 archaeon SCGC-AAA382A20 TaxID=1698280 RepID=A0A133VJ71_9EURY|nr:methyltransferase [candidate division MSBL1 archaeon SCGC-AAA382A20]
MKIDDAGLNMIAGWAQNDDIIMIEEMPIFGGYAGGLEESTLCDMCAHLISFTTYNGSWHLEGPIHVRWGITTSRESLAMAGHVAASLDKHTDLLLGNQYYPLSGPCTEMCLKEVSAQAITDTASGREIISGSASAKGVLENYTTGLEARMMSKAAEAIAGESVSKANEILDTLVGEYEQNYKEADTTKDPSNTKLGRGKKLNECYDMETLTPTEEYYEVYDTVLKDLEDLGLSF